MYNAMPTDDTFDSSDMRPRDQRGRLIGDETLRVKFYKKAERSEIKSEEMGRPVYVDLDFITIWIPGDDKTKIDTIATDVHKERFPVEWKRYKELGLETEVGTPLEQWGALPESQVAEFKHFNIRTVEALAAMPDGLAQKFMGGGHDIREKAKKYLKAASDAAIVERQDAELAKRDAEIAELREMIKAIQPKSKSVEKAD